MQICPGDALPGNSNVRRSREVTEKGSDVQAIVDCGCVLRVTLCLHK